MMFCFCQQPITAEASIVKDKHMRSESVLARSLLLYVAAVAKQNNRGCSKHTEAMKEVNSMANEITYEITRHCGVIATEKSGWTRELNIVAWNGGEPKYDIRSWNEDHTRMTRGITLTCEEAASLAKILNAAI